jgi:hypothetical protein
MKKISILFFLVALIYSISVYANKLVFNQIVTQNGVSPYVQVNAGYNSTPPVIIYTGVVPANKVWKITGVGVDFTPFSNYLSLKINYNGIKYSSSATSPLNWLKAGDSVTLELWNSSNNGINNIPYYFNYIEFNVVP